MIVNSVIQSAKRRGGARLPDSCQGNESSDSAFSNISVHGGSEFGVDAAVADEGIANAPRDGWNAKRTNSSGLRALSHVNRRSHSCRFQRHLQRGAAWRKPETRSSSLPTEMPRCPGRSLCFPVRVGIGLLRVTTLAASHLSARGSGAAGRPLVSACPKRLGAIGGVEGRPQPPQPKEDTITNAVCGCCRPYSRPTTDAGPLP